MVTRVTSSILATAHSNTPFISQYASTLSVPTQHYYLQLCVGGRMGDVLGSMVLGFRSLDNYITRSLLHAGGFRHAIQTHL